MKNFNNTIVKVSILGLFVFSCANETNIKQVSTAHVRGSCSLEAEQLVKQVVSFEQPTKPKSVATILVPGRFIYRCEKRGEWTKVMYPEIGEKINCSYRKEVHRCSIGWVKGDITTLIFD